MNWACVLTNLGYDVQASGTNLRFKDEGVAFVLMVEPTDPLYIHIVLADVWNDGNMCDTVRTRAIAIANDVNALTKVSKVIVYDRGAVVSAEALCPSYLAAATLIPQLVKMAKVAGHLFDCRLHESRSSSGIGLALVR